MNFETTALPGVTLLSPPHYPDERGSFHPIFAERLHREAGFTETWTEMNLSHTEKGCVRGLHFQEPCPQAKLITVVSGAIFDVVVDLRPGPHFGKWASFEIAAKNPELPSQIYLPAGVAHGLATPDEAAAITYLVSEPWNPETEQVLAWNDPDLAIPWPLTAPRLSSRDSAGTSLRELKLKI